MLREKVPNVLTCYHTKRRMDGFTKLKADRPHPRDYPQMPTDYRHTDNHLRLVMVVVALTDGQTDATNSIISLLR